MSTFARLFNNIKRLRNLPYLRISCRQQQQLDYKILKKRVQLIRYLQLLQTNTFLKRENRPLQKQSQLLNSLLGCKHLDYMKKMVLLIILLLLNNHNLQGQAILLPDSLRFKFHKSCNLFLHHNKLEQEQALSSKEVIYILLGHQLTQRISIHIIPTLETTTSLLQTATSITLVRSNRLTSVQP